MTMQLTPRQRSVLAYNIIADLLMAEPFENVGVRVEQAFPGADEDLVDEVTARIRAAGFEFRDRALMVTDSGSDTRTVYCT